MSHVTHEWVISHMNETCHTWMSHVTHEWFMSHMNESCHTWMSHVTHECVMSHMNESCHTWMSHVTHECVMSHMNASCHTWMRHVTHEWVMSHMNESCHLSFVMPYPNSSKTSHIKYTRLIYNFATCHASPPPPPPYLKDSQPPKGAQRPRIFCNCTPIIIPCLRLFCCTSLWQK